MTSRPYDELNKRHKEFAEQARAQEAEKLKAVPEKDTPASGTRFGELKAAEKTVADEMSRQHSRHKASDIFKESAKEAVDPSFTERAVSPAPLMRVHADQDHEGVFPPAKPRQEPAPAKQAGALQPTPGGTEHRLSAVPERRNPWDQDRATVIDDKAPEREVPTGKENTWDRSRGAEMTDGRQAVQNREVNREITDSKQRNPFDREASDKAQKLVSTIAARTKEGLGREQAR